MKGIVAAGPSSDPSFAAQLIDWQKQHGREGLPWQNTRDAYRIWLSEIMLQQTQVAAVIPYYLKFLQRFPDLQTLAIAPSELVMAHWSGLGYYSRARNLHQCAKRVISDHGGIFPSDVRQLVELPGIGRSTAAAIAAFAYGTRAAILDGNVKRVFCRVFGIAGFPGSKPVEDQLWQRAESLLPQQDMERYTQGLMDLGATLCTRSRPQCARCPLAARCVALATGQVDTLPQRKPKKAVPHRVTGMLIILDEGQVLLQQRPDSGIWGGLLSLPEFALPAAPQAVERAVTPFGTMMHCQPLTPFAHAFTHFRLEVTPYLIRLSRRQHVASEETHLWYPTAQLPEAPLPAPIKKLLLQLLHSPDLLTQH